MKGVARSKRCQRCRRRKIKCDEAWPSCTQCIRAKAACSGPPPRSRLGGHSHQISSSSPIITTDTVTTGLTTTTSTSAFDYTLRYTSAAPNAPSSSQRPVRVTRSTSQNDLFSPDSSSGLRLDPTTTAERVAARLVSYLDKGSGYDASLAACYLRLLPARLGESAALRDTVALFCSCWGSFRRAVPSEQLIDARAYGKALRSLQRALDDPRQQLSCETLAATTIMDRVEILFEVRRRFGHATHARGIGTLMSRRGPPKVDDELDIHLTLGNMGTLLYFWLLHGGTNFFLTAPWKDALETALASGTTTAPRPLIDAWRLHAELACWPSLPHETNAIRETSPSDPRRAARAAALRDKAAGHAETAAQHADEFRRDALATGLVSEVQDAACPAGARYVLDGVETLQRWLVHASAALLLNRVVAELAGAAGSSRAALDAEHRVLCRRVWMCLPQMLGLGPMAWVVFSAPVMLSLEGGDEAERDYVLGCVLEMDRYRGRLPRQRGPLMEMLMLMARMITGRERAGVGRLSQSA